MINLDFNLHDQLKSDIKYHISKFPDGQQSITITSSVVTDSGVKKSAKGLLMVYEEDGVIKLKDQCTWEEEGRGLLQIVFEDGKFYNQTTLTKIRQKLNENGIV